MMDKIPPANAIYLKLIASTMIAIRVVSILILLPLFILTLGFVSFIESVEHDDEDKGIDYPIFPSG